MPTKLINFKINTIGSVDRPACAPALVALVKRRADLSTDLPEDDLLEGMNKRKEEGTVIFIPENIKKGLPADVIAQLDELAKKVPAELKPQLEEYNKSVGQLDELKKQAALVADLQKKAGEVDPLKKQLQEAQTQLDELKKGGAPKPEDILKSLTGDTKALVETLFKRVEESDKKVQEALAKADSERDARVTKEYIMKAEGFKALPVKPAEFGLVLKAFGEHNKEMYTQLEAVLKSCDELVSKSKLMDELGTGREGGDNEAWAEVEKRAADLMKRGLFTTKEQAISEVFKQDQALYKKYREEA